VTGETAGQELDDRATAGDPEAMVQLALTRAAAGDAPSARQWLERAAEAGSVDALFVRGVLEESAGDQRSACDWWLRAAEAGSGDAMFNLSASAQEAGDASTAAAWLERAAEAGNGAALHNLGVQALESGDTAMAHTWFEHAAGTGRAESMVALADVLERHGATDQAAQWYAKALAAAGSDAEIEYRYAVCLGKIGEEQQAKTHLLRAATAKHAPAAVLLGDLARVAGDRAEAAYWYTAAAERGAAAGLLGLSLTHADEGDFAAAEKTLAQAAEAGEPHAIELLAQLRSARSKNEPSPTQPESPR
jgi:TPR repeat protein